MKMWIKSGLAAILGIVLLGDVGTQFAHADDSSQLNNEIKQLQAQISAMHDDINKLSGRIKKLEDLVPKQQEPVRVDVNLDSAHILGDDHAKLGIVEFADFQCPYCRHFYQSVFPQLKKSYIDTGKVSFIVRNFPLDFHPHAMNAALAVSCVAKQDPGAYWDIQQQLFGHQKRLGKDYFKELAHHYGLDQAKFEACSNDPEQKKLIQKDYNYARTLGVTGTPTFFIGKIKGGKLINAVRMEGVRPYNVFSQVIAYVNNETKASDNKKD